MPHLIAARRLGAAAAAALTLSACSIIGPREGDYLLPAGGMMNYAYGRAIGEPLFAHLYDLDPRQGDKPVHFLRIDVLGAPKGLVVDRVAAINEFDRRTEGGIGVVFSDIWLEKLKPAMVPVDHITITPRCTHGALVCYPWYTIAQYHLSAPGQYQTTGIRVTYEVGGTVYYQDFRDRVGASTGDWKSSP